MHSQTLRMKHQLFPLSFCICISHLVLSRNFRKALPPKISRTDWTLIISPPKISFNLYRWHQTSFFTFFVVLLLYRGAVGFFTAEKFFVYAAETARRPCGVAPNSHGWNLGFVLLVALELTSLLPPSGRSGSGGVFEGQKRTHPFCCLGDLLGMWNYADIWGILS